MRPALILVAIAAATTAASQTQNPRSIPVSGAAAPGQLAFSVIQLGTSDAYTDGGAIVISNSDDWKKYLQKIHDTGKHSVIDWKRRQAIAVHLASSPSAANGFIITRVVQKPDEVDIEIVLNKPARGGGSKQPATITQAVSPYEVIVTSKFDAPIKTLIVDK